ncbi:SAM-dependent methyltransferase [Desertivibrio insolitus]|uniref:SAM-dependent methyltransferase n=1 Tax=Herbiconiux sp. SYSU D00978 TaxID=2812562 RepID=UPI001A97A14E|nr:SAM-dependent methyltransferase [Herbiconiux sp. SYSU D00978]
MRIELEPIGHVTSTRAEIRDDDWDSEVASITLDPAVFTADALRGLEEFSHVEIVYFFDRVPPEGVEYGARRPRGNPDWPLTGIFAQRGKNRPNRLGLTIARVVAVDGLTLEVAGLDAIDGTPVLDIKPYMREFGPRGDMRQPMWATELMSGYWASGD